MTATAKPQNAKFKCGATPKIVFSFPDNISIIQQYITVPKPIAEKPQAQIPAKNHPYDGENDVKVPQITTIVSIIIMVLLRPILLHFMAIIENIGFPNGPSFRHGNFFIFFNPRDEEISLPETN